MERDLIQAVLRYAVNQRATGLISERQLQGMKTAVEVANEDTMPSTLSYIMMSLNENYERSLKEWHDSKRLIIRP